MRIQKIGYTPAFGYNKELNKQLKKKLSEDPETYLSNTVRDLNIYCNRTEKMLDYFTATKDEAKTQDLLYALINPKLTLANMVENMYPELDYTNRELQSYYYSKNDKTNNDESWQMYMAEVLAKFITVQDNELTQEQQTIIDTAENFNLHKTQEGMPDVIEKFEPSFSTPKGFSSLGGMVELKEQLTDKILNPALNPEQAKQDLAEYGKRPPRGIILYGPPGCGKTSIVEALSMESELPLFKLKVSRAGSPYINQTSKNYQAAFDYVADCAQMIEAPCFLFIDEIDGLSKSRGKEASSEDLKQMGTLLNLIETARDRNIIVLGATNKYDIVDDAIKRRFDEQIYIGMPDMQTREDVLQKTLAKWLKGVPLSQNKDDLRAIAEKLNDFPTSAIVILADKASDKARKDFRRNILKEDFLEAINENQNLKIDEKAYTYTPQKSITKVGYKIN